MTSFITPKTAIWYSQSNIICAGDIAAKAIAGTALTVKKKRNKKSPPNGRLFNFR
jgi:hypothetical protein